MALWGDDLPIQRCTVHKHLILLAHSPTLRAILDSHPKSRIEDLMPWRHPQPSSLAA